MRINKLFSNLGICSRKETNRIIEENRVMVNGKICTQGQWIEKDDIILMDGKPIHEREKTYIVLNKPIGIICTAAKDVDDNIIDFLNYPDYIFPVGRLDKESEGLILMTNDGELANKILESENEHEKEYIVKVDREIDDLFINNMSLGVEICNRRTRPCKVKRIDNNRFNIILTQGLNRQIRRMSKVFGYNVIELKRIRILNIEIDGIEVGEWRKLTNKEIEVLQKC